MLNGKQLNELITRLKNDDRQAFDSLYRQFSSAVYGNVLKLTKEEVVAEDIVQEVFLTLWKKRNTIDIEKDMAGWLFTISYNKSIDHIKKRAKEILIQESIQPADDVVDELLISNQIKVLENALDDLSPQKRRVFELCKLQQKTYDAAAKELQISTHTVKEYLSLATLSIKQYVHHYHQSEQIKNNEI